jgi:hypothetical protein
MIRTPTVWQVIVAITPNHGALFSGVRSPRRRWTASRSRTATDTICGLDEIMHELGCRSLCHTSLAIAACWTPAVHSAFHPWLIVKAVFCPQPTRFQRGYSATLTGR